jgi:hypothetical protein
MKIIRKPLDQLKAPEKNIRLHSDKQLAEFKRSVEMFGQIRPIVIDEQNTILAGNGLAETLRRMGRTEADCYQVTGLTDVQKKKLMMADNRIFDLGVDDMAAFDAVLKDLGGDLDVPGFDEDMLKALVMDAPDIGGLISDYGKIPPERAEEMRDTGIRYEQREQEAAQQAVQQQPAVQPPGQVTDQLREFTGNTPAYMAESREHRYVECPKCGERIWL